MRKYLIGPDAQRKWHKVTCIFHIVIVVNIIYSLSAQLGNEEVSTIYQH